VLAELSRKNTELAQLYERVHALAGRMADDLHLAARIQRGLLPAAPDDARLDIACELIPFQEIGGDYYDLIPLTPGCLGLALGDVMGKGVPAALLAASLKTGLRAHAGGGRLTPQAAVAGVNRLFWEVSPKGRFATLFFAHLDLAAGRLEYVNAGHDPPLVLRADGRVERLAGTGPALGLLEQADFHASSLRFASGDMLVAYSDGVTDRVDARGEPFGLERLIERALAVRHDPARLALYSLLGELQGFAAGAAAEDDLTLLVVRRR
jgi:sigma-B regulation protein RsbU (phosphoserine phosphatase)